MNTKRIEIGDRIVVNWSDDEWIIGVVDYVPVATRDCWIINRDDTAEVMYVQNFLRITLLEKGEAAIPLDAFVAGQADISSWKNGGPDKGQLTNEQRHLN